MQLNAIREGRQTSARLELPPLEIGNSVTMSSSSLESPLSSSSSSSSSPHSSPSPLSRALARTCGRTFKTDFHGTMAIVNILWWNHQVCASYVNQKFADNNFHASTSSMLRPPSISSSGLGLSPPSLSSIASKSSTWRRKWIVMFLLAVFQRVNKQEDVKIKKRQDEELAIVKV